MIQWLTTAPDPRSPATGHGAGQRGWRLHAVEVEDITSFSDIKRKRAICGIRPRYGWGLDLFITDPCERCMQITGQRPVNGG
jgi:hypothetical protein